MSAYGITAYGFTVIVLCIAAGAFFIALGELKTETWVRPCRWCFWTAIALLVGVLGFPGWFMLWLVL